MESKPESGFPASLVYSAAEHKSDGYRKEYWEKLRALYAGGVELLESPCMKDIFPAHMYEQSDVYAERVKRAFYVNYAGEIIDHIVSALMMHPVKAWTDDVSDDFYDKFSEDLSFPGGKRRSLQQLMRHQVLTALLCKTAWTLVDFPPVMEYTTEPGSAISEADQRESGALDAYAIPIEPENVFDWAESPDGDLLWVKVCVTHRDRSFDGETRNITEEYTIYTRSSWARYAITYDERKPPRDKDPVDLVASGSHSFSRVPLIRMEMPYGLWAMNKLESMAREHMNKRCALSWAEYKTLYPTLYEFESAGAGDCISDGVGDDSGRFVNQTRGIGYVQVRAEGDSAKYVGPDSAPFKSSLESLKDLRDEMHRVMHQMALSFDNHASSLRRSGDSKAQDKQDAFVVLNALGQLAREHVYDMFVEVSKGRGDTAQWAVEGLDKFDTQDANELLTQAERVKLLDIPSETFESEYNCLVAKAVLGEHVTRDIMGTIESEIDIGVRQADTEEETVEEDQEAQDE